MSSVQLSTSSFCGGDFSGDDCDSVAGCDVCFFFVGLKTLCLPGLNFSDRVFHLCTGQKLQQQDVLLLLKDTLNKDAAKWGSDILGRVINLARPCKATAFANVGWVILR